MADEGAERKKVSIEPADLESFVRPVFGLYIAIAFGMVFQSVFLGLLAAAFLVYMPRPKTGEDVGGVMLINKLYFLAIMIGIVILAFNAPGTLGLGLDMGAEIFKPWEWNTNAIIFGGVWLIAFVTGLMADLESRQIVGAITIAICFVIFTMGVGSQEVGNAFFGQWWPVVHNTIDGLMEPVGEFFSTFQQTFGSAFLMLTNPIGYATQMLNGTYVDNPTGATGAYGMVIKQIDIDQIYVTKQFPITVTIKNEGAFDARDVKLELITTLRKGSANDDYTPITEFGFKEPSIDFETLVQQDMRQHMFFSDGISCEVATQYELRERYLPFRATVSYEYDVDSNLEVQFMSKDEWDRLVRENKLHTAPVVSKISTSPVRLSIGTLDQPIREGTPFYVGLKIESSIDKSSIDWANVEIKIPKSLFVIPDNYKEIKCTPHQPKPENIKEEDDKIVISWPLFCKGDSCKSSNTIYCNFEGIKIEQATQTFLVYGSADYRISQWKSAESSLQFGDQKVCEDTKSSTTGGTGEESETISWQSSDCLEDASASSTSLSRGTFVLSEIIQSNEDYSITEQKVNEYLNEYASDNLKTSARDFFYYNGQDLINDFDIDPAYVVAVAMTQTFCGSENQWFVLPEDEDFETLEKAIFTVYGASKNSATILEKNTAYEFIQLTDMSDEAKNLWAATVSGLRAKIQAS